MKVKNKMQCLIKVRFTKEFAGHSIDSVIATDRQTVEFLLSKDVCELYKAVAKQEKVTDNIEPKRKGNPNWAKKEK